MLSIIIPNYKRFDLLQKCINSILQQSIIKYEIIVVDNSSNIHSPFNIHDVRLKFIWLEKNEGFSRAVNIGVKAAQGEYLAILNNDTEISPKWIETVIDTFERNKDIMFITSKIKKLLDKDFLDDTGDVLLISGKVYKIGNNEKDIGQYDKQRVIFGASGCASVYRRQFFNNVGYFDEDFFAYLEDIDLSFRANILGYKCLYVPDAVVYHVGSATTGSQYNDFTVFHLAQNTISVIVKDFPAKILLRSILSIITHIISLQAFFLLKGFGGAYFKGLLSGLKMIVKMIPKRHEIMKNRVLTDDEIIRMFCENKKLYKSSKKQKKTHK